MRSTVEKGSRPVLSQARNATLERAVRGGRGGRLALRGAGAFIVFKGGYEVGRMVGARGKSELMRALADVD